MTFLAAAIQLGPSSSTISETTERIIDQIEKAGRMGVRLAVLPELALTPYFAAAVHDDPEIYARRQETDAALMRISGAVRAAGLVAIVPLAETEADGLYNGMAVLDECGRRIGTFRKMHIPGQREPKPDGAFTIMEKRYFKPGDLGFGVFPTSVGNLGGLICYDRRFPESYRSLSLQGAEIICIGFNTPVTPGSADATLAKSRRASELAMRGGAYFTASYVIAAGKAGRENGVLYIGGSQIIAPDGEILQRARTSGDEIVACAIDLERVHTMRQRAKYEENMRTDAYVTRAAGSVNVFEPAL